MDYERFTKKLATPVGFTVPTRLRFEHLEARAITRADLSDDVRGINASLELISRTRGGGWPTEPVTEAGNYVDLVWHELEFRDGYSFTYAVYDTGGTYLGCCYLYPLGRRTELSEALLHYDVDVSWWVIPAAYERGDYVRLYGALRHWLATEFPFWRPYYSNRELPEMDDRQIRELLTNMVTELDADAEYELRHEDFVAEMPQSGERIRGRDNMRAMQRAFPPDRTPTFRVRRITGGGDIWTVEAVGDYGGEIFLVVCVFEFREGKIARETRYYPQPFEAPEWRTPWVEPMDDALDR